MGLCARLHQEIGIITMASRCMIQPREVRYTSERFISSRKYITSDHFLLQYISEHNDPARNKSNVQSVYLSPMRTINRNNGSSCFGLSSAPMR